MSSIKLNKKSWHYQVASFGNVYSIEYQVHDFCSYIRVVFKGLFLILLAILAGVVFGYLMVIQPGIWALGGFQTWYFENNDVLRSGLVIWAFVCFSISLGVYLTWRDSRRNLQQDSGFFTLWYRSFKDKVCFKVDFE